MRVEASAAASLLLLPAAASPPPPPTPSSSSSPPLLKHHASPLPSTYPSLMASFHGMQAAAASQLVTIEFDDGRGEEHDDDDDDDIAPDPVLGWEGEYSFTRLHRFSIKVGGVFAGTMSTILIDRARCGTSFHAACDAASSHLQAIGCALFQGNGRPRYAALKSDPSVGRGGFLYVDSLDLEEEYRQGGSSDVGSAALVALLHTAPLAGRWTVAAYVASVGEHFHSVEMYDETGTPEDAAGRVERGRGCRAADARQFFRAGFVETSLDMGGWLYITAGMSDANAASGRPMLTHAEALAIPTRLMPQLALPQDGSAPPSRPVPSAKDTVLMRALMQALSAARDAATYGVNGVYAVAVDDKAPATILQLIDMHVALGADPSRSLALHVVAASAYSDLIHPLCQRGCDVDAKDNLGVTPLMIAASTASRGTLAGGNRKPDTRTVAVLLALRADRNARCDSGKTALGHYKATARSHDDFLRVMGMSGGMELDDELVNMLMPDGGETEADLFENDDVEDEEDDEYDDEDEEDDEYDDEDEE